MLIDTTSELIADIDASVARAHLPDLSGLDRELTLHHLQYLLPRLREPNTHIAAVQHALAALRANKKAAWYTRPFGIVFLAVVGTVIAGFLLYLLGWTGQYDWKRDPSASASAPPASAPPASAKSTAPNTSAEK